MKNLLNVWDDIKVLLEGSVFLISDFDGTLTPIVDHPDDAYLSEDMRLLLERLSILCPLGIISGRNVDDLESRVEIPDIYYSGNHGYEIVGPNIDFVKKEAGKAKEAIAVICDRLESNTGEIGGTIVENKGYTASVHYRMVDEQKVSEVKNIVREGVEPFQDLVELSYGKKVLELGPKLDWDKGKAVLLLQEVADIEENALSVYIGDDVTDEDAFSVLGDSDLGILVSEEVKDSAADYGLKDVLEVQKFLGRLLDVFG